MTVSAGGRDLVAASDEFDVTFRDDLPRPWLFSRLVPGADDPESDLIVGTQLLNSGLPAEARTVLERAGRRKPDSEEAALALARSYFVLGETARDPRPPPALPGQGQGPEIRDVHLAGQAFGRLGEHARAIAVLDQAVTVFGVNTELLNEIGDAHARLGQKREALAAFDRSLQIDPKQAEIRKKADALREKK